MSNRFSKNDINLNRIVKANNKSYEELVHDLEEEKLYLTRLYQQGKNEHARLQSNIIDLSDEIEFTQTIIKNKEEMLKVLQNKNPSKRGNF